MDKKRVGVMTFHMAHNYGAMLQAYALTQAVGQLNCVCEVVDYRFAYIDQWGRIDYFPDLVARHGLVGGALRYAKRLFKGYYDPGSMRIRFSKFERDIIPKSSAVYTDPKELEGLDYDALLFGSDQIWNSALTDGPAGEYAGAFSVPAHTKKIAYAASCGGSDFQPESKALYLRHIRQFHAVGVREKGLEKTLHGEGICAETVLDPTLLLHRESWLDMVNRTKSRLQKPKAYLLVYAFDEDEALYDEARRLAAERGLDMIAIAYQEKPSMEGMQVLTNCGPADFVNLFADAAAVITTSFHGTAFSVIMQRDFYCVPHPKYRERTDSLLRTLGLWQRNVEDISLIGRADPIQWEQVEPVLQREQEVSMAFLKRALELES